MYGSNGLINRGLAENLYRQMPFAPSAQAAPGINRPPIFELL
jgi:hypothetical protein